MGETVESLGLTYETILKAYQSFFSENLIGDVLSSFKFLAIAIFLLSVGTNMISTMGSSWKLGEVKLPYNQNKFLTSLAFVLVIAFYDKLLHLMDNLFLPIDSYFGHYQSIKIKETVNEVDVVEQSGSWMAEIKRTAIIIRNVFMAKEPSLMLSMFTFFAKIIDAMIYVVFLVERFFFLGLVKILGPFAILFSIFSAKRDMFEKWLKVYMAVYLLIIPFYLVIGFTSQIVDVINKRLELQAPVTDLIFGNAILTVAIMVIIWIKLRLFKKSYEFVYKIIS